MPHLIIHVLVLYICWCWISLAPTNHSKNCTLVQGLWKPARNHRPLYFWLYTLVDITEWNLPALNDTTRCQWMGPSIYKKKDRDIWRNSAVKTSTPVDDWIQSCVFNVTCIDLNMFFDFLFRKRDLFLWGGGGEKKENDQLRKLWETFILMNKSSYDTAS